MGTAPAAPMGFLCSPLSCQGACEHFETCCLSPEGRYCHKSVLMCCPSVEQCILNKMTASSFVLLKSSLQFLQLIISMSLIPRLPM